MITRSIKNADKDPEENALVFNAQSGINFDTGSFMDFSFGVPVWGNIDVLNSIIAFDVNYKIGNKRVCLLFLFRLILRKNVLLQYCPSNTIL